MEAPQNLIAEHPFWSGFPEEHLIPLTAASSLVQYEAEVAIFREGEPAQAFYLILRGKVALQTGIPGHGYITIQTIGEGDPLGFSWLYLPYQWNFGARTQERVEVIKFDAEKLRQLAQANPEFGRELAMRVGQVVLQRLHFTRLQLMDFYSTE